MRPRTSHHPGRDSRAPAWGTLLTLPPLSLAVLLWLVAALLWLLAPPLACAGGTYISFDDYRGKWPKQRTVGSGAIERTEDQAASGDYSLHIQSGNPDAAEARSHAYPLDFTGGDYYSVETLYYSNEMPHWCLVLDNGQVHIVHDGGWFKYRTAAGVNHNICPASAGVWYSIDCWVRWPSGVYDIWIVGDDGTDVTIEDAAFFMDTPRSYEDDQYYLRIGDFTDATNHCDAYWDDIEVSQGYPWPVKFEDDFEEDSLEPAWTDIWMAEDGDYFGLTTVDFWNDTPGLWIHSPGLSHRASGSCPPFGDFDPEHEWEAAVRFKLLGICDEFHLWDNGQVSIGIESDYDIVAYTPGGEVTIADGACIWEENWYGLEVTVDADAGTYDARVLDGWTETGSASGIDFSQDDPDTTATGEYQIQIGDLHTTHGYGQAIIDDLLLAQTSTSSRGVGMAGSGYRIGGEGGGSFGLDEIPWTLTTDLTDAEFDSSGTGLYITGGESLVDAAVYLATGEMLDPVQILPPEYQPGGRLNAIAWNPAGTEALLVGEREGGIGPARVFQFDRVDFTPVAPIAGMEVDLHDVAWRPDGSLALLVGGIAEAGLSAVFGYTPAGGIYAIGTLTYGPCEAVAWCPSGTEALIVTSGPAPGAPGEVFLCDGTSLVPLGFTGSLPWIFASVAFHPDQDFALIGGGTETGLETVLLRYEAGALEEIFTHPEAGCVRVVAWDPAGDFALGVTALPDGRRARLLSDGRGCVCLHDAQLAAPINALAWAPPGGASAIPQRPEARRRLLLWSDPNPSGSRVRFHLEIPEPLAADLAIFDLTGRRVRTLLAGTGLAAGHSSYTWDGTDEAGGRVPAGVFFCRLEAGGRRAVTRLLWVR